MLEKSTEENIIFDEPHISLRCQEYKITKEQITYIMLREIASLVNLIEDRPQVYKLYFKLNERRQLKIVTDIFEYRKIRVRTIRIIDRKIYKNTHILRKGRW